MSVKSILPSSLYSIGGFLGERFQANRVGRLKDILLSEQYIRLHERKDHDSWFWIGEQVGKWLDAATYTGLIARDQGLLEQVQRVLERLAHTQEEDGYLGITARRNRIPVRGMDLYEKYYVLHGLLVCHELLGSDVALEMAIRLVDYITHTWGVEAGQFPLAGRFPGNGHGGGEGTLILEPVVLLGEKTGEERYIKWGESTLNKWDEWLRAYPESRFTCGYTAMQQFAGGEKDVYELRENIHAHTFHMTLLGVAALYNACGRREYRDVVLGCIDRLAEEWIFLTGGMSSGEGYLPRRYYHPRGEIEVCPQHTWILLCWQALEWTGEARYAAEMERALFNHFLAAQLADGSNWSYMTPLNGRAQEPYGPNCCNASGQRIVGRMPVYLYGLRDNAPAIFIYTESEASLQPKGLPAIRLRQETSYPSQGIITIHVQPEYTARFALHLRIPPFGAGARFELVDALTQQVRLTETGTFHAQADDFLVIEREWMPGDIIRLELPMPIVCQANEGVAAVVRGPLVYAYFQDIQDEAGIYLGRHGLYPEDIALIIDPARPSDNLVAEPTGKGLLGPALRAYGHVRPKAPMFARAKANQAMPGQEEISVLLLPFANQGKIGGEYEVFIDYA